MKTRCDVCKEIVKTKDQGSLFAYENVQSEKKSIPGVP